MGAGLLVLSSIILAFVATRTPLDSEPGIFSVLLLDVLATTLIAHPNAVLGGGFSALYLVTVAAASMLLRDRQLATLVAALATLSILVDTVFHLATDTSDQGGLLAAGLRGILIFVVSWIGQIVTANMTVAEQRAQEATSEAERLQELNDEIVEHIQTGISQSPVTIRYERSTMRHEISSTSVTAGRNRSSRLTRTWRLHSKNGERVADSDPNPSNPKA